MRIRAQTHDTNTIAKRIIYYGRPYSTWHNHRWYIFLVLLVVPLVGILVYVFLRRRRRRKMVAPPTTNQQYFQTQQTGGYYNSQSPPYPYQPEGYQPNGYRQGYQQEYQGGGYGQQQYNMTEEYERPPGPPPAHYKA